MSDLVLRANSLPDTIEDLTKFVLVGREKLISVRAEIRAIDKLNIAQEVRAQKREECLMLSEALLDAETRLGDLLKQIPKGSGGDRKSDKFKNDSSDDFETTKVVVDTSVHNQKPKKEVISELGFNQKQAERFETLANNKDLVEYVKAEARENDDIPTRSRVLELAKQRKKREDEEAEKNADYYEYIDFCTETAKRFSSVLGEVRKLKVDDKHLKGWAEHLDNPNFLDGEIQKVDEALSNILVIQRFLKGVRTNGKANCFGKKS